MGVIKFPENRKSANRNSSITPSRICRTANLPNTCSTVAAAKKSWYHNIRYTYSSNLRNSVSRTAIRDTLDNRTGFNRTNRSGWQHLIRPSFSTKVLKYFNFAPSIGFEELWVPDYLKYTYDDSTKTTKIDTVSGFQARHLMTGIGANVSTTMCGLFEIPFSPMKVVRHKMDPSIGFSYAPDYTDEAFGYFQEVRDGNGNWSRNAINLPTTHSAAHRAAANSAI
ncbi:MAG: putative LPS assembly protein LptD [Calditrichia bacterium]